MNHAFGAALTLGIEEELFLVDPVSLRLAPVAERVMTAIAAPNGAVGREAYAAEIELRSPPCADVTEAVRALAAVRAAAQSAGARLMGAGLHPAGCLGDAPLTADERCATVADALRGLLTLTPACALHIHVGMPDPETAVRVCNGLRSHLPLITALAANSPWWFGRDSGLASARSALIAGHPGRGIPPVFRDYEDYCAAVDAIIDVSGLNDYTFVWWDARLHPRLGTLEVRALDAQASLDHVAALAALVHVLAHRLMEAPAVTEVPDEALAWAMFRAARDGVGALLPHDGKMLPVERLTRRLQDWLRPAARELSADDALAGLDRILYTNGGAGCQRVVYSAHGMAGLLAWLVRETAVGDSPLR